MDPRYRYPAQIPSGRRSPTLNPARATMPVSVGYSSLYGGDIHVMPSPRYESMTPRGHASDYRHPPTPTTTRTYAVTKDPISRSSSVREVSRNRRSSTIDSAQKRPVIVTTTTRPHASTSAASGGGPRRSSPTRAGSPTRDSYRSSDEGAYYAQPASSMHSRSHNRNSYSGQSFSATLDNEEFLRLRERHDSLLAPRADVYRARPQSTYANIPRHSAMAIDYGDEGYEYTNPSDLARYDLDNDRPSRRHRDSFDRNYYRPSVSVSTDLARPYELGRRGGPPPTTWGLDKLNRTAASGIYDPPQIRMPVPPAVPLAPIDPARRSGHLDMPGSPTERRSSSRHRPVSLYQESQPRSSHHDEYYRSHEDELVQRDLHDRERDRDYFLDDNVVPRGFGIRLDGKDHEDYRRDPEPRGYDDRRERRESRRDYEEREPKRRSDEDLEKVKDDRKGIDDRDRKAGRDAGRRDDDLIERKGGKDKDAGRKDDDDRDRKKIRDKVATGLGVTAASIGLAPTVKGKDENVDRDEREPPRRRKESDDPRRKDSDDLDVPISRTTDRYQSRAKDLDERKPSIRDDLEIVEPPKERSSRKERLDAEDVGARRPSRKERGDVEESEARDRNRREAEARLAGEPVEVQGSSSSEEGKPKSRTRRQRPASAFKPTDTAGLMELKAQLAAMEEKEKPTIKEASPERRTPPSPGKQEPVADTALVTTKEDYRGRVLAPPAPDEKQVRVVSPPREKEEKKPLKGILKQPSSKFPEETNPIREGVAPHKDDKTKQNVPNGARWTKISRKLVNPEALTIGKERFEVRDDFVIVLRVLSKEEIQAYTAATAQLREMRRKEFEREREDDYDQERERERERDDDDRRRHRRHRKEKDEEDDDRERERERSHREREKDRHRRHRRPSDEEEEEADTRPRAIEYHTHNHHHRSHRDRERDREAVLNDG